MRETLTFALASVAGMIVLLYAQPRGRRTVFEPGALIVSFVSLCYLVPGFVLVTLGLFSAELTPVIEKISQCGLWFICSFVPFYLLISRIPSVRWVSDGRLDVPWSPATLFWWSI